jgi:hypothetical protein
MSRMDTDFSRAWLALKSLTHIPHPCGSGLAEPWSSPRIAYWLGR